MEKSNCLILSCLALMIGLKSLEAQVGGYGGAFLRNEVGSRAAAMGGAYTAVANDVSASFWNPAGLAHIYSPQFMFMWSHLALQQRFDYVGVAWPSQAYGVLSLSFIGYSTADIMGRDEAGNKTGYFSDEERAVLLAYGNALFSHRLLFGITAKFLQHKLARVQANGLGYDFGMQWQPRAIVRFGLSLQNINTGLRWQNNDQEIETFPKVGKLGALVQPFRFLSFALDYEVLQPPRTELKIGLRSMDRWHFGWEAQWQDVFCLRGGMNGRWINLGMGLLLPLRSTRVQLNYALSYNDLDRNGAHKIDILLNLGSAPSAGDKHSIPTRTLQPAQIIEVKGENILVETEDEAELRSGNFIMFYKTISPYVIKVNGQINWIKAKRCSIKILSPQKFPFNTGEKIILRCGEKEF